jgi:voltage-gated potassium channel
MTGDSLDGINSESGPIVAQRWARRDFQDEYGIALGLLLLVLILPLFVPDERWGDALVAAIAVLGALVALHTSHVQVWLFRTACAAALLSIVALSVDATEPGEGLRWIYFVTIGFLLFVTPMAVLVRIAHHTVITPRTLYGALCVYLLIGLGFSFVYQAVVHATPTSFTGLEIGDRVAFTYYSFITLTTVGYGDITPVSDTARSLATFQAVFGQIFLVVVVARVVSMLGHERDPASAPILSRIHRLDDVDDPDDTEITGDADGELDP